MRYHDIEKVSLVNGEGVRTVLWVSGCNHYCKGCQNPVTWDPNDGLDFNSDAEVELFKCLDHDYIDGLTLSGGDPMYPDNREVVTRICKRFRHRYGDKKTIWMYTGFKLSDLLDEEVLDYLDVIVDGEFVEELKDVHYMWAGSTNQVVWRKEEGGWKPTREWG